MPIGGGKFVTYNKVLPGAYINFVSTSHAVQLGTRGVVAMPLSLDWGEPAKVIPVDASDFNATCLKTFAVGPTDKSLLLLTEALKRAKRVLVYRVNGAGQKATATVGGLTVTAKYPGTAGNKISVGVIQNVDDTSKVDVVTLLSGREVDRQVVPKTGGVSQLKPNDYVVFTGASDITTGSVTALTGGTNSTPTASDYANFLTAIEVEQFNVIAYPGTDASIQSLFISFVKRLRDDNGIKIVGVLANNSADYLGIINVANGVILADGTVLPAEEAVAWVAGATASAEVNQSLTNTAYDGAVDVDTKYTKSQLEQAIREGKFVFYPDNGKARVLTDINSMVTIPEGMSNDWTSNRVVRVMDSWANDIARIFGQMYMGLMTNGDLGRTLFKADIVSLGLQYQQIGAIQNFSADDVEVLQGESKRDVIVNCAIQPLDSMEKLYMTVTVK